MRDLTIGHEETSYGLCTLMPIKSGGNTKGMVSQLEEAISSLSCMAVTRLSSL